MEFESSTGKSHETPSLQIGYVANRGSSHISQIDLNQADPALSLAAINADEGPFEVDDFSPYEQDARPFVTNCTTHAGALLRLHSIPKLPWNKSTSSFNSLQATLDTSLRKWVVLIGRLHLGASIDTAGNTSNLGFAPQNSLDYAAEKGNGDYDIVTGLLCRATYDLPSRKNWDNCFKDGR